MVWTLNTVLLLLKHVLQFCDKIIQLFGYLMRLFSYCWRNSVHWMNIMVFLENQKKRIKHNFDSFRHKDHWIISFPVDLLACLPVSPTSNPVCLIFSCWCHSVSDSWLPVILSTICLILNCHTSTLFLIFNFLSSYSPCALFLTVFILSTLCLIFKCLSSCPHCFWFSTFCQLIHSVSILTIAGHFDNSNR